MKRFLQSLGAWTRAGGRRSPRRRLAVLAGAAALAWAVFGGSQGLFALILSQREKAALRAEIGSLDRENRGLQAQIALLDSHPEGYERTAREKLLLMRPGEIIYRFQ